jgi:hypothetical protein
VVMHTRPRSTRIRTKSTITRGDAPGSELSMGASRVRLGAASHGSARLSTAHVGPTVPRSGPPRRAHRHGLRTPPRLAYRRSLIWYNTGQTPRYAEELHDARVPQPCPPRRCGHNCAIHCYARMSVRRTGPSACGLSFHDPGSQH